MIHGADESEFERLPDLYQRWVEVWLPGGIPREREATCFDCPMCARGHAAPCHAMGFFEPSTKCCTYFPELPNFLVGRAITGDTAGAAALRAFVNGEAANRANVTLRAVQPDAKTVTVYTHHRQEAFGRDPEMRCPYLIAPDPEVGPLCGIWRHRNSVCSTWFCKHDKGLTGCEFWYVLQGLLGSLEWSLSWWAIMQVLDDPATVVAPAETQLSVRNKVALRPDAWRHWAGSRTSFYEACAECVERLSAREALELGGMEARIHLLAAESCFSELSDCEVPERLRTAPFGIVTQDVQRAVLKSARFAEPFEAPAMLLPLLHHFDGRPTAIVLEAIRETTRVRLSPGLVRRLYDFGILEKADGQFTT